MAIVYQSKAQDTTLASFITGNDTIQVESPFIAPVFKVDSANLIATTGWVEDSLKSMADILKDSTKLYNPIAAESDSTIQIKEGYIYSNAKSLTIYNIIGQKIKKTEDESIPLHSLQKGILILITELDTVKLLNR